VGDLLERFLTEEPLELDRLIREVMRDSDGACVTFAGVVRNHHRGRSVESIYYDAYRPMAEKEIAKIVEDVRARHPATQLAVRHRIGLLVVGETSIAIAVSSPHREDAFIASRELIDRIKQTVPIWKRERTTDGEEWVDWQWS
jgi:molybdopterin synthase catalytic subunit